MKGNILGICHKGFMAMDSDEDIRNIDPLFLDNLYLGG